MVHRKVLSVLCVLSLCFQFVASPMIFASDSPVQNIPEFLKSGPKPWTHMKWNNDPDNFQFVIVADRTGGEREGVFDAGIQKVNLLQPEFVISVGDLIEGYTDDVKQIEKEWAELDGILAQLNMPFFFVPGNHDVGGEALVEFWLKKFGATYYHFVYRDVLFLCLDSESEVMSFSEEQLAYVEKTLKSHPDVRWTLVFLHRPAWQAVRYFGKEEGRAVIEESGWGKVESLLKHRKHTVFAGHTHEYHHHTQHNQDYITLAATGGGFEGKDNFLEFDHVLWVTMTDDGPIMANLMLNGIWSKEISRQDVQDYLTVMMSDKVVRYEEKEFHDMPTEDQPFIVRLTNSQDIPMKIKLKFDKSDYVTFVPGEINKTIRPNSVEKVKVQLKLNKKNWPTEKQITKFAEDEEAMEAFAENLWPVMLRWKIDYDFKSVGKIKLSGRKGLF